MTYADEILAKGERAVSDKETPEWMNACERPKCSCGHDFMDGKCSQIAELESERDRLRGLLKKLEFVESSELDDEYKPIFKCPYCGGERTKHSTRCEIKEALASGAGPKE